MSKEDQVHLFELIYKINHQKMISHKTTLEDIVGVTKISIPYDEVLISMKSLKTHTVMFPLHQ